METKEEDLFCLWRRFNITNMLDFHNFCFLSVTKTLVWICFILEAVEVNVHNTTEHSCVVTVVVFNMDAFMFYAWTASKIKLLISGFLQGL